MMKWLPQLIAACLLILLAPSTGSGAVYKCKAADGSASFSDKPCPDALRKDGYKWTDIEAEERQRAEAAENAARLQNERRAAERAEQRAAEARRQRERERAIANAQVLGLYVVEYVISGSASAVSVTYTNAGGGIEQHDTAPPWRLMMTVGRGHFVSISAQNRNDYGDVAVEILVNGVQVKSSRSTADYGIASADGVI